MPNTKKKDESQHGGGIAPQTQLRIGPDRRAQAVLRRAEQPKTISVSRERGLTYTDSVIKNPGVGILSRKETIQYPKTRGTDSNLSFNRYKPGAGEALSRSAYSTKRERKYDNPKPPNAHNLHKDRLRSAAVKHAMGRQLTDVRPGNKVYAQANRSGPGRNARARAYEYNTKGALNFDRGRNNTASSTKLTKDTWQPSNTDTPVKFNPNNLKNSLKALAQGTIVRATTKLIGGPYAQAATTIDDSVAAATGKRPSKTIAQGHVNQQSKLVNDLQIRKKKQAPWAGSGPF